MFENITHSVIYLYRNHDYTVKNFHEIENFFTTFTDHFDLNFENDFQDFQFPSKNKTSADVLMFFSHLIYLYV